MPNQDFDVKAIMVLLSYFPW